jgi:hypothetical protein
MEAASAPSVGTPRDRILALLDALADQVRPEYCRGCPFLMALAEYLDLAGHLTLVMEGVYASVAALGTEGPVAVARGAAETLLDAEQVPRYDGPSSCRSRSLGPRNPCTAPTSSASPAHTRKFKDSSAQVMTQYLRLCRTCVVPESRIPPGYSLRYFSGSFIRKPRKN